MSTGSQEVSADRIASELKGNTLRVYWFVMNASNQTVGTITVNTTLDLGGLPGSVVTANRPSSLPWRSLFSKSTGIPSWILTKLRLLRVVTIGLVLSAVPEMPSERFWPELPIKPKIAIKTIGKAKPKATVAGLRSDALSAYQVIAR